MKTIFTPVAAIAGLFLLSITTNSCKKIDNGGIDTPKEQQVIGTWNINRIQLKIYSGSTFLKDTIIPQHPNPVNFVRFAGANEFEYKFNNSLNVGAYQFKGSDSLISNVTSGIYRWKMLTLTKVLFTVMSTSTNDPLYPGKKVETYQTFVR
ncbi:MAG TPA: hypothetical protein VK489_01920 [Ferruginibacter sp.]|nr:hypothetical protein [Ferruginibacter sp.]